MDHNNDKGRGADDANPDSRIADARRLMEQALALLDSCKEGMGACYLSMAIESLERS